ncbi:hypothetical protein [Photorhabdus cinerea]|uniref:Uncharacterized protein n=1 Tax=Photorhabdus cinerea TaxID=471575 RepID=A0A7X5TIC4_9GAMM|nr:hypothetical protein [Photorhabdus cinerea]NHB94696.1 hypothetical protein [Photorhabdus cinerea]
MGHESLIAGLNYIQEIIKRMAANSLFVKGWSISLTTIAIALVKKDYASHNLLLLGIALLIFNFLFSLLDCFYLKQERIFRNEYNKKVLKITDEGIKENLTIISTKKTKISFCDVYFSISIIPFYLVTMFLGFLLPIWR